MTVQVVTQLPYGSAGAFELGSGGGGGGGGSGATLPWAPPTLTSPITINIPVSGYGQSGSSGLNNSKDYIINYPPEQVTGQVYINGGRNIQLIGGSATITSAVTGNARGLIQFLDESTSGGAVVQGRTIHIEGFLGQGLGTGTTSIVGFDGFDFNCSSANVQIQNCRIVGLSGHFGSSPSANGAADTQYHSDIIQNQGGAKSVKVWNFTGSTDYQAFFITDANPFPSFKVGNCDLSFWRKNPDTDTSGQGGYTMLLWNGATPVDIIGPFVLSNSRSLGQYSTVSGTQTVLGPPPDGLSGAIWLQGGSGSEDANGNITLTGLNVTGTITDGNTKPTAVPSGGFCGTGSCGLGYVSPGYL